MTYTEATEYFNRRLVALENERAALRSALRALEVAKAAPPAAVSRPKYTSTPEIFALLPASPDHAIELAHWERRAIHDTGISKSEFMQLRVEAIISGAITKTPEGRYYRRPTP